MTKRGAGAAGTPSLAKDNFVWRMWQKPLNPTGMESSKWTALQWSSLLFLRSLFGLGTRLIYQRIYRADFCIINCSSSSILFNSPFLKCSLLHGLETTLEGSYSGRPTLTLVRDTYCHSDLASSITAQRPHQNIKMCAKPQHQLGRSVPSTVTGWPFHLTAYIFLFPRHQIRW